jgi:outer membrane protein assembly factor BamE (lipoprotein component of BamABCDE complex)
MEAIMVRRTLEPSMLGITLALGLAVSGCQPVTNNHGFLPEPDVIGRIQPGTTTRAEVTEMLGTPTTVAAFDDNTWLYINRRTEQQFQFMRPTLVEQTVLAITFDRSGRVAQMRRMGEQDGADVEFIARATPSQGKELSLWDQIVGNIGRFNNTRGGRGGTGAPQGGN